ncbi:MAG: DUF4363 family protein [Clostridia bacterium]|nr:DUF4363 family protein [Clostridia bacterium]
MKRSVICFSLLFVMVAAGAVSEIFYSNSLARNIDRTINQCQSSDFDEKARLCRELSDRFDGKEVLNELFFSRELIDKISRGLSDLIIYAEYKDEKNFRRALNSLKICNQEIHNAGIF